MPPSVESMAILTLTRCKHRFHAIYFPAFLLALDIPLPRTLLSHQHWTANQMKMSKSLGNVVDPFVEMETHGVDVVRWYLTRVGGRFRTDAGAWIPVNVPHCFVLFCLRSPIPMLMGALCCRLVWQATAETQSRAARSTRELLPPHYFGEDRSEVAAVTPACAPGPCDLTKATKSKRGLKLRGNSHGGIRERDWK